MKKNLFEKLSAWLADYEDVSLIMVGKDLTCEEAERYLYHEAFSILYDIYQEENETRTKLVCGRCGSGKITQRARIMLNPNDIEKGVKGLNWELSLCWEDFYWCSSCEDKCSSREIKDVVGFRVRTSKTNE